MILSIDAIMEIVSLVESHIEEVKEFIQVPLTKTEMRENQHVIAQRRYSRATGNEGIFPSGRYNSPKAQQPAPLSKPVIKNNRLKFTLTVTNPLLMLLEGLS